MSSRYQVELEEVDLVNDEAKIKEHFVQLKASALVDRTVIHLAPEGGSSYPIGGSNSRRWLSDFKFCVKDWTRGKKGIFVKILLAIILFVSIFMIGYAVGINDHNHPETPISDDHLTSPPLTTTSPPLTTTSPPLTTTSPPLTTTSSLLTTTSSLLTTTEVEGSANDDDVNVDA